MLCRQADSGRMGHMAEITRDIIRERFESLGAFELPLWEDLPDIGLYMDQVVTYIERQLRPIMGKEVGRFITASMINNYAKSKVIPRTEGKKYAQEHIALLLAVFTLKRVLSLQDLTELFGGLSDTDSIVEFYGFFRSCIGAAASATAGQIEKEASDKKTGGRAGSRPVAEARTALSRRLSLQCAVEASLKSFASEALIGLEKDL